MKNIFILLSSILILTSCGMVTTSNTNTPDTKNQKATSMSSALNYIADLDATSSKIKNSEEFQGCMKQNTNMCIQSTGMQLAQKAKDPTFCRELLTPDQRSNCEFTIIMINATEKNDEKICDTISDTNYQKQCKVQIYKQEAISKKDITLCNKVNTLMKSAGTGAVLDTGMQKDQCIMQYIMSWVSTDSKDCENLSNTGSLEMCKTMIKNRPIVSTIPSGDNTRPPVSGPPLQSAPTNIR
jgi:hypothetical protein